MKKRMKFVGVSAAFLIALSSTPLQFIGGVGEQVVYADSSYDTILQSAIKSNYSEVRDWEEYIEPLKELVNLGPNNDLYLGSESITSNSFYTDVLESKIFNGQRLKDILGVAGSGAKAQILVDGKSQVTQDDLLNPSLKLTVIIFATNQKTAEATVNLTTNSPVLSVNEDVVTLTQQFGGQYLDFEDSTSLTVTNNNGDAPWSVDEVISVTPNAERLKLDGILNDEDQYVKSGTYSQDIVAKLVNSDSGVVTRKLTVTVTVEEPKEDALKFEGNGPNGKTYKTGSTVLKSNVQELDGTVTPLSEAKFASVLVLNNPEFYNFATKETNNEELSEKLKQRFSELFKVSDGISAIATPINMDKLIVDSTSVDLSKVGVYTVPFLYETGTGHSMNLSLQLEVRSPGNPVFQFNTNQNKTIMIGEDFSLYDFQIFSNSNDLNLGNENIGLIDGVTITGSVNTSKVGTYKLTYSATNIYHLTTTLTRTINVVDPNGSTNEKPEISSFTSVGYVNYVTGYGIRVWSTPDGNATGQFLPHSTAWKIDQKATFKDGRIWYRVGTDQWIDGQYIKFSPVSPDPGMDNLKGIGTINYVPGYSVNVYQGPKDVSENWTGAQLKHGTKWRVFGEKNGFYNVGENQWVSSKYMTFVKD